MRTVLLIDNVNMGKGHDSLTALAKKFRVNPENLAPGEVLMFLNRRRDKLKVLGAMGKVVGYLKMPGGQRIELQAIQYLPKTFNPDLEVNYSEALKEALTRALSARPNSDDPYRQVYRD